jgi:hypothetical protein
VQIRVRGRGKLVFCRLRAPMNGSPIARLVSCEESVAEELNLEWVSADVASAGPRLCRGTAQQNYV